MIYINYSHKDEAMTRALVEYLSQQGYAVGYDSGIADETWMETISDAIRKCDVFIILITKNSIGSKDVLYQARFAIREARQRDKIILPVVFDRDDLKLSTRWSSILRRYKWIKCDSKNPDWIWFVSYTIAEGYGNEQRKQKQYEEYSELQKSDNSLYASEKLTEIMDLILKELEGAAPSGKRKSLLMELDRCLEQIEALYDYDYSSEARSIARKKLDILNRISSLPECTQKETADIFSVACGVRFLHWHREIRWQGVDTVTGGDLSEGIIKTIPESESVKKQGLFNELFKAALASDNWQEDYSETEADFILQTKKFLNESPEPPRKEQTSRQEQASPDEKMETIARYIQDGNRVFELIGQDEKAVDFLRCLITSYERLRNYCDVVGARKISAECAERIADLKQRFMQIREDKDLQATKAERGIKALLGITVPGSGEYDVFLSHKKEDDDIAGYVYGFLKTYMKEVFFDKISLPEISRSEYRKAIMTALDHSKHFIVIVTQIETLQETDSQDWVQREMEAFHTEIFEGRKEDSNFIILATDEVYNQIISQNKRNIYIDWRNYTILKISDYRETLMSYIK